MKTFTIDQFRKYLVSQDSLGDVLHNLSEENIEIANQEYRDEDFYNYDDYDEPYDGGDS